MTDGADSIIPGLSKKLKPCFTKEKEREFRRQFAEAMKAREEERKKLKPSKAVLMERIKNEKRKK